MNDETRRIFSSVERRLIRNKLFHYMIDNGIGAPALANLINSRVAPDSISLKTLQRFLIGDTKTYDASVKACHRFTESMPSPDPLKELGKGAADSYGLHSHGNDLFWMEFNNEAPIAESFVHDDEGFSRVFEKNYIGIKIVQCEGILVSNHSIAVALLRDVLTKKPKHYFIKLEGVVRSGCGMYVEFNPSPLRREASVRTLSFTLFEPQTARSRHPLEPRIQSKPTRVLESKPEPTPSSRPTLSERQLRWLKILTATRRLVVGLVNPLLRFIDDRMAEMGAASPDAFVKIQSEFLAAAERGDTVALRRLLDKGADINKPDFETGLTALHLAIGRYAKDAVRFLVERGAKFVPDKFGRMPTVIAIECEANEELCDFVAEAEARALGV